MEALFDVELPDGTFDLIAAGPVVRAIAQDERSQARNRELATQRIVDQVAAAAKPRRKRRKTVPSPASREQRLEEKKRRGGVKRLRQPPDPD